MMDDKMKAAFHLMCMDTEMNDEERLGAKMALEWTLDYLRSQQEPIGEVSGHDTEIALLYDSHEPGSPVFAHPVPSAPAVPEWQPIETAPKDGTAILVMRDIWPGTKSGRAEDCNGHNTYVAAWWGDDNGAWICYMDAVQDPECPIEPTHWMPLPAAPSPTEKKEG